MTNPHPDCEARRERLGLLLDGETAAAGEADLFRHLGECAACRAFGDTLLLLRQAAARERAASGPVADTIPLPATGGAAVADLSAARRRPARREPATWRLPVPAAVAAALVLLLGGALLGATATSGAAGGRAARTRPPVVVVCSLPEVVVR